MTTAWGGVRPEERDPGDALQYFLAGAFGVLAGWVDIRVGDLLFTALLVLASCMLLGFVRPKNAWRWVRAGGNFCAAHGLVCVRGPVAESRSGRRSTSRFWHSCLGSWAPTAEPLRMVS